MSDIFLSYASSDRETARALGHRLEREGWSVWWDRQIPPGKTYDDVIEQALLSAKCIVVLWSKASTTSDWVKIEAEEGKQRGNLVPALIEESRIPLAFRRIQAANILGWQSSEKATEFDQFLQAIRTTLGDTGLHAEASHSVAGEPRPNPETASKRADINASIAPASAPQDDLSIFLTRSYDEWLGGKLSGLSINYQDAAGNDGKDQFIKGLESAFGPMLKAALRIGAFSEDEFLIASHKSSSFFLTNRRLFIFSQDSVTGPITTIRLSDIRSYKFISGFWRNRIELVMKNGEILTIKGLTTAPKEDFMKNLLSSK